MSKILGFFKNLGLSVAVAALFFGISVCALATYHSFSSGKAFYETDPEFKILKRHFSQYRDSIESIELSIRRGNENAGILMEELENAKAEYKALLTDLISFEEKANQWSWDKWILNFNQLIVKLNSLPSLIAIVMLFITFAILVFKPKGKQSSRFASMRKLQAKSKGAEQNRDARNLEEAMAQIRKLAESSKAKLKGQQQPKQQDSRINSNSQAKASSLNTAVSDNPKQFEIDETVDSRETAETFAEDEILNDEALQLGLANGAENPSVKSPNFIGPDTTKSTPRRNTETGRWRSFQEEENQRQEILKLARRGMTSSEISRRLRISQDQVDVIVRLHRENPTG